MEQWAGENLRGGRNVNIKSSFITWSVSRSSSSFFMISGVGTLSSSTSLSDSSWSSTGGGGGGVEQAGEGGHEVRGGGGRGAGGRGGGWSSLSTGAWSEVTSLSPARGSQGSHTPVMLGVTLTTLGVCKVLVDWIAFLMSLMAAATLWPESGPGASGAGEGGGSLEVMDSMARMLVTRCCCCPLVLVLFSCSWCSMFLMLSCSSCWM